MTHCKPRRGLFPTCPLLRYPPKNPTSTGAPMAPLFYEEVILNDCYRDLVRL